MLNFELLQPLLQPNWALTPFLSSPPTIAEYKSNKSKYQSEIIEAGIYRITAAKFAVHSRGDDIILWRDPDYWAWRQMSITDRRGLNMPWKSDKRMIVRSSNEVWTRSLERGTISYNNGVYQFIGAFEKNGNVIHFNTLHEETLNYV